MNAVKSQSIVESTAIYAPVATKCGESVSISWNLPEFPSEMREMLCYIEEMTGLALDMQNFCFKDGKLVLEIESEVACE